MAKGILRRYDVQAKVSLILSAVGMLGTVALFLLALRNFKTDLRVIVYAKDGMFAPLMLIGVAVTLVIAATGVAMGANSAGQKRNELGKLSWLALLHRGRRHFRRPDCVCWFLVQQMPCVGRPFCALFSTEVAEIRRCLIDKSDSCCSKSFPCPQLRLLNATSSLTSDHSV